MTLFFWLGERFVGDPICVADSFLLTTSIIGLTGAETDTDADQQNAQILLHRTSFRFLK